MKLQFLTAQNGQPLAKTCTAAGTWSAFPNTYLYRHHTAEAANINELLCALRQAARDGACFVQGQVNTERQGIRRLVGSRIEKGLLVQGTIDLAPLKVVAFDVDKLPLPLELQPHILDHVQLGRYAASFLGLTFSESSMIVQFTSKHAGKPDVACLRLWFILATPATPADCKAVCERANDLSGTNCFDPAIFNTAQIHYLAPPIFVDPEADPCRLVDRFQAVTRWVAAATVPPAPVVPAKPFNPGQHAPMTGLTPTLQSWASGQIPDAGFHPALLQQALNAARLGFNPNSVAASIKLALSEGLPASQLSDARREEIHSRCVAGNEVDRAVDWAAGMVQAQNVALKGIWLRDLAAAERAEDPWLYALAMLSRYVRRAPKRLHTLALAARIARAARLSADDQASLNQAALALAAQRRGQAAKSTPQTGSDAAGVLRNRAQRALAAAKEQSAALSHRKLPELDPLMELEGNTLRYLTAPDLETASMICEGNPKAICVVIAPMGTGKTEVLLKKQINQSRSSVVINHRRSLVADSCKRLGLKDYRDKDFNFQRLGLCIDSLPLYAEKMKSLDLLCVDEFTQVIAAACLPGPMKQQALVQKQLIETIKTAKRVILTEASLTPEALVFLSRAMRKLVVVEVIAPEKLLQATILSGCEDGKAAMTQVRRWLNEGEKVLVATDSSELVSNLAALCEETGLAANEFACVNSDSAGGHEGLLRNINANVANLRLLAYSPTIQSGVSLTEKHFTKHLGAYNGVVTPSDFVQMLRRDRTAETFYLAIAEDVHSGLETDMAALHEQWLRTASEEHLRERLAGFFTNADVDRAMHLAALNQQLNDAGNNLVFQLEDAGWQVDYEDFEELDAEREAVKETVAARKERQQQEILASPALFGEEWRALERKQERGKLLPSEVAIYKHGVARRWLCLDDAAALDAGPLVPLAAEHLAFYDDGAAIPRVRALEMILGTKRSIGIESYRDEKRLMSDKIHPLTRNEVYRTILSDELLAVVETGAGGWALTPQFAEALWESLARDPVVFRGLGLNVPKAKPARICGWAKGVLTGLGICFAAKKQVGGGAGRGEWAFPVDFVATQASVEVARRRIAWMEANDDSPLSLVAYRKTIANSDLPKEAKELMLRRLDGK